MAAAIGTAAASAAAGAIATQVIDKGVPTMSLNIGGFFSNLFGSSSATGTVQTGSVTLTDAQLITALTVLEGMGVVVAPKTQAVATQIVQTLQLLGVPIDQALLAKVMAGLAS